jgi:hypothetical protein
MGHKIRIYNVQGLFRKMCIAHQPNSGTHMSVWRLKHQSGISAICNVLLVEWWFFETFSYSGVFLKRLPDMWLFFVIFSVHRCSSAECGCRSCSRHTRR